MATYTIKSAIHPERAVNVDNETFKQFVKLIATLKNTDVTITATFDKDGNGISYICSVYI